MGVDKNEKEWKLNDPFYSESNIKAIKESIKQLNNGEVIVKTIDELKKLEKKNKQRGPEYQVPFVAINCNCK